MDLRDFVKNALSQIAQGASDAAEAVSGVGGIVNPAVTPGSTGALRDGHFATLNNGAPVFLVDFDVAVTVTDSGEVGGGVKGGVLQVFAAKVEGKSANTTESASRLRFKVPLALGVDAVTAAALEQRRQKNQQAVDRHQSGTSY